MDKKKVIVHINNVSKILGTKRQTLSAGTLEHLQNELKLALIELSKSDWISVEDELPPYEEYVWVTCKENTDAVWNSYRQKKLCKDAHLNALLDHNGFTILIGNYPITHWRKIEKLEV